MSDRPALDPVVCCGCDGEGIVDDRGFKLVGQPFFTTITCRRCKGTKVEPEPVPRVALDPVARALIILWRSNGGETDIDKPGLRVDDAHANGEAWVARDAEHVAGLAARLKAIVRAEFEAERAELNAEANGYLDKLHAINVALLRVLGDERREGESSVDAIKRLGALADVGRKSEAVVEAARVMSSPHSEESELEIMINIDNALDELDAAKGGAW